METRICSLCLIEYPEMNEYFSKDSSKRCGLRTECKLCEKKRNHDRYLANTEKYKQEHKEYYESHKEQALDYSKKWKLEHPERTKELNKQSAEKCRDKRLVKQSAYRQVHREELKGKSRQYYQDNLQQCIKTRARWNREHRNVLTFVTQQYRSKKKQLVCTLTLEQWEDTKRQFDNKCAYCGRDLPLAQDHFIAVWNGGHFTQENILPACTSCNTSKSNRNFSEWYPTYRYYSEERMKNILDYLGYINLTH